MDVSIRELRANTKEIIDTVNRGVSVTVKSHGHACAQIVPIKSTRKEVSIDPAFGMWESHKDMVDVHKFIRKLREGRSL
ncbi:MAG: type II toxin-antitoxin system prevent-host-death family antitoxin [Gammaproteobacteria bacterium]|nr:type II toxin-antitoxin system prevent-host-death family antitoxin [Gammaproteobacteria bacterium]